MIKSLRAEKCCSRIGIILVVVGVIGEWRCGAKLEDAHNAIHEYDIAKLTAAETHIAELNKDAEHERLARVQIEEALAWRSLSPHAERILSDRIGQFRDRGINFIYQAGDAEGAAFAWDMAMNLHKKGVKVTSPGAMGHMPPLGAPFNPATAALRTGIVIQATEEGSRQAAKAFRDALMSCGFDAILASQLIPKGMVGEATGYSIWVFIETRPKGPQGEAKLRAEKRKQASSTQTVSQ